MRKLHRFERRRWFTERKALPGWIVQWRYGKTSDGSLVLGGIRISPAYTAADRAQMRDHRWTPPVPGAGITNRLLRSLVLTEIQSTATWQRGLRAFWRETDRAEREQRAGARVGRPMARKIDWYERVASAYKATPQGKKASLAKQFRVSESSMRSIIHRCRKMGLIGKASR